MAQLIFSFSFWWISDVGIEAFRASYIVFKNLLLHHWSSLGISEQSSLRFMQDGNLSLAFGLFVGNPQGDCSVALHT